MQSGRSEGARDDATLVVLARRGDAGAFEKLVVRYMPVARYVARVLTHDDTDAEDVCQEAFLEALRDIAKCRHPERFQAWLSAIVRHCAHAAREKRAADLRPPPAEDDPAHGVGADPSHKAQVAELRDDLRTALEGLTDLQREVVILHDVDGWKHREIADLLGITEGSSRVRLHVAHLRLRNRLHDHLAEV